MKTPRTDFNTQSHSDKENVWYQKLAKRAKADGEIALKKLSQTAQQFGSYVYSFSEGKTKNYEMAALATTYLALEASINFFRGNNASFFMSTFGALTAGAMGANQYCEEKFGHGALQFVPLQFFQPANTQAVPTPTTDMTRESSQQMKKSM